MSYMGEVIKMEYHLKYKNIKAETVEAVRKAIIEDKIFRKEGEDRLRVLRALNEKLCLIYNVNPCELVMTPNFYGVGQYQAENNKIVFNEKLSLVTFLHEFKHFLRHRVDRIVPTAQNILEMFAGISKEEEIARGWSISLFYKASEKHFRRALEKGLIIHQKAIKQASEVENEQN